MLESVGTALVIGLLVSIFFGRKVLKHWFDAREEDVKVSIAEDIPERVQRIQEINARYEEVLNANGGNLITIDQLLEKTSKGASNESK